MIVRKKWMTVLLIALSITLVAACSTNNGGTSGNGGVGNTDNSGSNGGAAQREEAFDPMAKYDPPITLRTVSGQNPSLQFAKGESWDKNMAYDAYEKHLGIKIVNDWVVDATQLNQKLTVTMSSGSLPDLMKVFKLEDVYMLEEAGLIMDLTELYEQYATEATRAWMAEDGGLQLDTAKINGRLMAIPLTNSPYNSAQYLFVRKDWLDELRLPEPKTMQDVLNISKAFKENDMGGSGTFGFGFRGDIFSTVYSATGFANGFHAYPGQWITDESGELVYGSIQPEMKTVLKTLQNMYVNGEIDPEFGVKASAQMIELISQDKLGMIYGEFWNPSSMQPAVVKDGTVSQEWAVYPLPSVDDRPALTQTNVGVGGYYVVSKKAKNPEAVIKLLNWSVSKRDLLPPEELALYDGEPENGAKNYQELNPLYIHSPTVNVRGGIEIPKAIETGDTSGLVEPDWKNRYEWSMAYINGDTSQWGVWMAGKPGGTMSLMAQYKDNGLYHFNKYTGPPTKTMVERNATLKAEELEVFTKIILNQVSIEAFDEFVKNWNALGGENITKEVNEWYRNNK